jgi:polar amino acid transport system substrate-binding protein
MRISPRAASLTAVSAFALLLMACSAPASAPATVSPSTAASASASQEASCSPDSLQTKTAGTFTVGTDNPAFPPYFAEPKKGETAADPWEFADPTNGRGFESATAYALAKQLGYDSGHVKWIAVPFNNSFSPGPKDFDIYLAQVSFTEERTKAADLSEGYLFSNQALVALKDNAVAKATSLADVAKARLGAAANTTSLTYIQDRIQPSQEPRVYDDNTGAVNGLTNGQVDGILVDLPTAKYLVNVELDDAVVVGQFASDPAEQEHFSFVLEKDSPLTDCVNQALVALRDDGTLDSLRDEWLADFLDAPTIQ